MSDPTQVGLSVLVLSRKATQVGVGGRTPRDGDGVFVVVPSCANTTPPPQKKIAIRTAFPRPEHRKQASESRIDPERMTGDPQP